MFFLIIAGSALVVLLGEYIPRPVATVLEGALGVAWALFLLCMTVGALGGLYEAFSGLRPRQEPVLRRFWFQVFVGFLAIVGLAVLLDRWVPHDWTAGICVCAVAVWLLARDMRRDYKLSGRETAAFVVGFVGFWGVLPWALVALLQYLVR
jgi:hypothetical protein